MFSECSGLFWRFGAVIWGLKMVGSFTINDFFWDFFPFFVVEILSSAKNWPRFNMDWFNLWRLCRMASSNLGNLVKKIQAEKCVFSAAAIALGSSNSHTIQISEQKCFQVWSRCWGYHRSFFFGEGVFRNIHFFESWKALWEKKHRVTGTHWDEGTFLYFCVDVLILKIILKG